METFKAQNEKINQLTLLQQDAPSQLALEVFRICTETFNYCLDKGEEFTSPQHLRLLKECAEISRLTASFLLEESVYAHDLCGVCAKVCDACAVSCAGIDDQDGQLMICQAACNQCADSCRQQEH